MSDRRVLKEFVAVRLGRGLVGGRVACATIRGAPWWSDTLVCSILVAASGDCSCTRVLTLCPTA